MAVLLRALALLAALAATASAAAVKSGNLRDESALAEPVRPMRQLEAVWSRLDTKNMAQMEPMDALTGGDAVVVFVDPASEPEAQTKSSFVFSFDVLSNANCVVSVCGTQRKWYTGARERCFDLRVASKSGNPDENGLIRGISAAYEGWRPVADNLYLKFDATNFIDGSPCKYKILSGSKVIREDAMAASASAASGHH